MSARLPSAVWHVSADTIAATIAGGLVLLVFYPLTLCAAGIKGLVRMARPHLSGHRGENQRRHSATPY